jgi:hypothetical protein
VLDDAIEVHHGADTSSAAESRPAGQCTAPESGWFVRLTGGDRTDETAAPCLLAALGIRMRRTSPLVIRTGECCQWVLTHPCTRPHLLAALEVLAAKTRCRTWCIRGIEP